MSIDRHSLNSGVPLIQLSTYVTLNTFRLCMQILEMVISNLRSYNYNYKRLLMVLSFEKKRYLESFPKKENHKNMILGLVEQSTNL